MDNNQSSAPVSLNPQNVTVNNPQIEAPQSKNTISIPPKKRLIKLIIVLVVINVLGFAGLQILLKVRSGNKTDKNSNVPKQTDVVDKYDLDISKWKIFENADMNITFKYPGSWRTAKYEFSERHEVSTDKLTIISGGVKNPENNTVYSYNELVNTANNEYPNHSVPYSLLDLSGTRFNIPGDKYTEDFIILENPANPENIIAISFSYDNGNLQAEEVFKKILTTVKRVN